MTAGRHPARDNAGPALRRPARCSGGPGVGAAPAPGQEPIDHDDPASRTRGRPRCATGDARPHPADRHASARVRDQGADRRRHLQHRLPRLGPRAAAQGRGQGVHAGVDGRAHPGIDERRRRRRPPSRCRPRRPEGFINEARLLARFDHAVAGQGLPLLGRERHRLHGDALLRRPDPEGGARRARPRAERGRAACLAEADPQRRHAAARGRDLAPEHRPRRDPPDAVRPGPARLRGGGARDRGDEPHAGGGAEGRLRRDRAVRQRGGNDARPVDRPVRARRRDLRGDHRQRAGARPPIGSPTTGCARWRSSRRASTAPDSWPRSTRPWRCSRSSARPTTPSFAP